VKQLTADNLQITLLAQTDKALFISYQHTVSSLWQVTPRISELACSGELYRLTFNL